MSTGAQAIISDVHANLPALKAVLEDVRREGIERIICLGDIVGYGPNPAECADLVRIHCKVTLRGDHEFALPMPFRFERYARAALDWTRERLKPGLLSLWKKRARWRFLQTLPGCHQEADVLYVHASPASPMECLAEPGAKGTGEAPAGKMQQVFSSIDRLCFVGHTHRPGALAEGEGFLPLAGVPNGVYVPPEEGKAIVNVGSVGRPEDGDPRACYVVFDGREVRYHRVEYDAARAAADIAKAADLDRELGSRLREDR